MARILKFDNIYNARNFGDYAGYDGRKLSSNKLYRTAHMSSASDSDLEKLKSLNIGLIVDLRYLAERQRQPNRWPEGTTTRTLAYDATRTGQAPHEAFMENDLFEAQDAVNYMMNNYAARPNVAQFQTIFKDTLLHMAETGDGVIIHCAAGKDRTGTLVSLIQSVLGVSDADIMADYMLTLEAVDIESLLKPAAARQSERFGRKFTPDALRPMFGVQREYLQASLDAMGDPTEYARDQLGLRDKDIERLRSLYLD